LVRTTEGSTHRRAVVAFLAALAIVSCAAVAAAAPAEAGEGGFSAASPQPETAIATGPSQPVYPVRGPHKYWAGMGDGRGHQGVDIGSPCGTPLVAVQAGKVRYSKYHARAGNYTVIDLDGSTIDLMYAHLREPASVVAGQTVVAGQPIGLVGDTGNASGCHLHFEVWDGGYYTGGAPIDPMPFLVSWDGKHERAARRGG
jgi:murein DD-endopeptidase MepM/ murein hydrolase activator NlpD